MSQQTLALAGGGALALLLVGVFGFRAWHNAHGHGHLRALHWVQGEAPFLLAEEALSDVAGGGEDAVVHLALLRPSDGALVARVPVGAQTSFVGASNAGLWFSERARQGVHRRSWKSLEVDVTEDDWREKHVGLPSVVRVSGPLDPGQGIPILFRDGKEQWLDPGSLEVRPVREEVNRSWMARPSMALFDAQRGKSPIVKIGLLHGQAEFADGPHGRSLRCSGQAPSNEAFREPAFLTAAEEKTGLLLDGPSFLVLARASARDDSWALSRVDCTGKSRWNLLLRDPDVVGALAEDGALYLVTRSEHGRDSVRCIDLDSGAVRWTYE